MGLVLAALALLAVDWLQTLQIARHPERWKELNPLLGEHPTVARVNAWFAACMAVSCAFAWSLWGSEELAWLAAVLAVLEAICVVNNWRNGIRI